MTCLRAPVQYGFLVKNPVEGIKLPPPKRRKKSKPYVTPEQFEAAGGANSRALRQHGPRCRVYGLAG